MNTTDAGARGEEQAARYLQEKGWRILERNFSAPYGEVDIIAQDGKTLVFAEVKTRAYRAYGGPLMAVTPAKQKRLALTAASYIKAKSVKCDGIRFDVLCVLPQGIDHVPNAFSPKRTTL